jgi:hypothetical protein
VEAVLALASEDITPPIMAMPIVPGGVSYKSMSMTAPMRGQRCIVEGALTANQSPP